MWNAAELGAWRRAGFTDHPEPVGRTLFRLEQLDEYGVASDGSDYKRHRDGEPEPDPARKQPWLDTLQREGERGLYRSRVHVLDRPLHPYLRYECEWSYVPNSAAGEDVYILDRTESPLRAAEQAALDAVGDFWLLNGTEAVRMHYDAHGAFVGAQPVCDVRDYLRAAQLAMNKAVPFGVWWARHPEEHRKAVRAA